MSDCKFRTGARAGAGELENHGERSATGRWGDGKRQERVTVLTIVHGGHPRGIGEPARIADSLALRQSRHARTLVVGPRMTAARVAACHSGSSAGAPNDAPGTVDALGRRRRLR